MATFPRATVSEDGVTAMEKSLEVTVALAVPLMLPLVAVTVKGPPVAEPAVNRPVELMMPPPLTVQVKMGWGFSLTPN